MELTLKRTFSAQVLVRIAMLSAVAAVLQLFEFPIPFTPPWLKMDFSDLPAIIGAFALGPFAGVIIELVKNLLNFLLNGTVTGGVGEAANFLTGAAFVFTAGLIYQKKHSKTGAFTALAIGAVVFVIVGAILNAFLLMPLYQSIMKLDLVKIASSMLPIIKTNMDVVILGVVPFNAIKAIGLAIITLLLYKPLSPILHIKQR